MNRIAYSKLPENSTTTRIIQQASKHSLYYNQQLQKDIESDVKLEKLLEKLASTPKLDLINAKTIIDSRISDLEKSRITNQIHVLLDMDCFFCAVEILDRPELADVPMAVGDLSMISTANYPARKYGIRAALPGFIAKKLYPDLVLVPISMNKYQFYSNKFRDIVKDYDQNYTMGGLDEAYFNITEKCKSDSISPQDLVQEIRTRILKETGLTASAGIGPSYMIAKIASDMNKPNGQLLVEADGIYEFLDPILVKKIPGVGKVMTKLLNGLGIITIKDLRENLNIIQVLFSELTFEFLLKSSLGISDSFTSGQRQSCSVER